MKITVEIDPKKRQDFYDVRSELIEDDRKFDANLLRFLPYHQLHLCCIGNAGDTVCSPDLVAQEKRARRQRFLSLENEDFAKCESLLRYEEMHDDVIRDINQQAAPHWDDLTTRQQTWALLNCLWAHLDNLLPRLQEARYLLGLCFDLPDDVRTHYTSKLDGLIMGVGRLPNEIMRSQLEEVRDNIRDFLPEPELSICQSEQIRGFICTSDCFRMVL